MRGTAVFLFACLLGLLVYLAFEPPEKGRQEAEDLLDSLQWPESFEEADGLISQLKSIGLPAIGPLLYRLKSQFGDEFYVREALKEFGPSSVAPLIHFVDANESMLSVDAWGMIGGLPLWMQKYILDPGEEATIKKSVYRLLVEIAPSDQTVLSLLIRGSKNDYEFSRSSAILFMPWMDERFTPQIVSTLIQHTDDPSFVVRIRVALSLGHYGTDSMPAFRALGNLLDDAHPAVRRVAARAIGESGKLDESVHSKLLLGLEDKDGGVRAACAGSLLQLGRDRKVSVAVLEKNLRGGFELERTLRVVETVGEDLIALVGLVEGLLENPNGIIQVAAARCLWSLKGDDSAFVSILIQLLESGNALASASAVPAVGLLGPAAEPAVPFLIATARSDPSLILRTVHALGKIGPAAAEAVSFLEDAEKHPAPVIQKAAYDALVAIQGAEGAGDPDD